MAWKPALNPRQDRHHPDPSVHVILNPGTPDDLNVRSEGTRYFVTCGRDLLKRYVTSPCHVHQNSVRLRNVTQVLEPAVYRNFGCFPDSPLTRRFSYAYGRQPSSLHYCL